MANPERGRTRLPWIIAVIVVVVVGVCGYALMRAGAGDVEAVNTVKPGVTTSTPSDEPTTGTTPRKESLDDRLFNVEGVAQSTLRADKGETSGTNGALGLACGGDHPTIMFKTVSPTAKTSLCADSPAGNSFRMVTRQSGKIYDMPAEYDYVGDAFIATADGERYVLEAYSGDILVTKDDTTKRQKSSDWISLDNEADYD